MLLRTLTLGFLGLGTTCAPAVAQSTIRLPDQPSCEPCQTRLEALARLGNPDDPAGFAPIVQIAVNSAGSYVVSSTTFGRELFIYDADGNFQRAIGRAGEGPGEFTRNQLLAFDARDSLHTNDMGGVRHTVFAPDFSFVRTTNTGARTMAMELEPTGRIFVVAPTVAGDVGYALQILSSESTSVHRFDPLPITARGQAALGRNIAVGSSGQRWSIGSAFYTLTEWDQQGRPLRRLQADREWIPDSIPMRLELGQRPPAQIGGIEFDEAGLLWVFAMVPDANWAPPAPGETPSPDAMLDTVFEIIDVRNASFVARGRSDSLVIPFAVGKAYSMIETPNGDLRLQVWRLAVTGR